MAWAAALAEMVSPFDEENFPQDWQELQDSLYACDVWNRKR
jgi:hypothetical protein